MRSHSTSLQFLRLDGSTESGSDLAGLPRQTPTTFDPDSHAAPLLVSYTLLLFEGSVRGATMLGLVGAGGIVVEGGILREGLAIRTDDLSLVTSEVAEELVQGGLTSIIDLRSIDEVSITGRGPLGQQPVAYHHIPLMGSIRGAVDSETPSLTHETMGYMYMGLIENAASQLVTALNIIAYSPEATAFHCAAGRDRTGVLAASLLLVLGASDADIVTDYALTGPNMPKIQERTRAVIGPIMLRIGFDLEKLSARNSLAESGMEVSMEYLLAELRAKYGDPLTPLRAAGLSDDTIAHLRRRALES